MKKLKGWKTFIFALAVGGTAVLADPGLKETVMNNFELTGAGVAFIIGVLRLVTDSSMFKSD